MVIVKEHEGIGRPRIRYQTNVLKLVDDRRRVQWVFYGIFGFLLAAGVYLCLWLARQGQDPTLGGVIYFGFVGGTLGYYAVAHVARSQACWVYPAESLIQVRRTIFGYCYHGRWIDLTHASLFDQSARLRGDRAARDPVAWLAVIASIPLGMFGVFLGTAIEQQVLLEASALCVRYQSGHVEVVVVVRGREKILELMSAADQMQTDARGE